MTHPPDCSPGFPMGVADEKIEKGQKMPVAVTTSDHFAITVSDLERSLAFYRDLLGLQVVERHRLEGDGISRMTGKAGVVMHVVRLAAPETHGILLDLQQY